MNGIFGIVKRLPYKSKAEAWRPISVDLTTQALNVVDYAHHEIHSGSMYYVVYSVASLGAMSSPDDMITLTFDTPDTTKWGHFQFSAKGTSGWRIRLIEGGTGGGASATGTLPILNKNRNSTKTSTFLDVEGSPTAAQVSYDATLVTGGTTLWDEYIEGSSGFFSTGFSSGGGDRNEIVLKQNTQYQVSLYGTDTDPATIYISWYEHTNRD